MRRSALRRHSIRSGASGRAVARIRLACTGVAAAAAALLAQTPAPAGELAGLSGHDDTYVYRLPYADDASFQVLQAYGSRFSHRGTEHYTLDFRMAEGTPVLSARGGVVAEVEGEHRRGCWAEGCGRLGNHVIVRHDDGTYAMYFHLAPGSIEVEAGDRIGRGEPLASSGNTGLTTTPHLHFGVYVLIDDSGMQSIPVRFETADGVAELRQGRHYRHPHRSAEPVHKSEAPWSLLPQD